MASLELTIVASDFRPVASGVGRLSAEVPAGLYEIVMRAGPVVARSLVRLDPGAVHQDLSIQMDFPAPAPVSGTSTSHEYHQELARAASHLPASTDPAADAGLVVMIRDVRGQSGPPLEPSDIAALALLDGRLQAVPGFADDWMAAPHDGAAAWRGRLPAGGYVLRTLATPPVAGSPRAPASETLDQSIWLSSHWLTLVFITTGPEGPQTSSASVHMIDLGAEWEPQEREVGLAIELAFWSLREGRSVVPDDLLRLLLGSKFRNPMLGILGAHAMLMRPDVDAGAVEQVLHNLDALVPGHPDVAALHRIAGSAAPSANAGATWPPMLLASYRALVAADARDPGAIGDGSVAEWAASNLVVRDVWTTWRPLDPIAMAAAPRPDATAIGVLPALAAAPDRLRGARFTDPAAGRVARYLSAVAALEPAETVGERFATMSPQEIGLATGLPGATVDRSLATIGAALLVPVAAGAAAAMGGGGGGAGSGGVAGGGTPGGAASGAGAGGSGVASSGLGSGGVTGATAGGAGSLVSAPIALGLALVGILAVGGAALGLGWFDRRDNRPTTPPPLVTAEPTHRATSAPTLPPTAVPSLATPEPSLPTPEPTSPPTPEPTLPPVPILQVDKSFDVGRAFIEKPRRRKFSLANVGEAPLTISDLVVDGDAGKEFSVYGDDCRSAPVQPGGTCTVGIQFAPLAAGDRVASLEIITAELGSHFVELRGIGDEPQTPVTLISDPTPVTFPTQVAIGTSAENKFVVVGSGGTIPVTITDSNIIVDGPSDFSFDLSGCFGRIIGPGDRCGIVVTFTPTTTGPRDVVLRLYTDDGASYDIQVNGTGYEQIL